LCLAPAAKKPEQPQQHMDRRDKTRVPAGFAYGHNARVPQLRRSAHVGWRITTTASPIDGDCTAVAGMLRSAWR
jgi:hypothetical protein